MARAFYIARPRESPLERLFYRGLLRRRPVPDFPRVVQIETRSGCNGRCVFCPNSQPRRNAPQGAMGWDLFRKIVDECARHEVTRYSPFLTNEPLLDRDIGRKIRYIREHVPPSAMIKINTNAALLDEEIGRELIESGLDAMSCSVHGIEPEAYEKAMGLTLENTLARIDRFLALRREMGSRKPRVRVTMVRTTLLEPQLPAIHAYWQARGVKVNVRPLDNRGNSTITSRGLNVRGWRRHTWCTDLFQQAFIHWNGDAVLCCVDWEREEVLGNLASQSLQEIWNGERYQEIRRRYLRGDVKGLLCARCFKQPRER